MANIKAGAQTPCNIIVDRENMCPNCWRKTRKINLLKQQRTMKSL